MRRTIDTLAKDTRRSFLQEFHFETHHKEILRPIDQNPRRASNVLRYPRASNLPFWQSIIPAGREQPEERKSWRNRPDGKLFCRHSRYAEWAARSRRRDRTLSILSRIQLGIHGSFSGRPDVKTKREMEKNFFSPEPKFGPGPGRCRGHPSLAFN